MKKTILALLLAAMSTGAMTESAVRDLAD